MIEGEQRIRSIGYRATVLVAIVFVLATLWVWALANGILVTLDWEFDDIHAYLGAANRLLEGEPLYVSTPDTSDLYLYAPWFAFAWIPLTWIPAQIVEVVWAVILIASFVACLWPYWRSWAGFALVLLLGGLLYRTVGWGNVQPLLLAFLIYLLPTPAGPWAAGIAASIKPWSVLAAGVYAWRREWRSVVICLATAAVLWAPIFLFNWRDYPAGERPPNIYDATFLLAALALLGIRTTVPAWRARRATARSGSREAAEG